MEDGTVFLDFEKIKADHPIERVVKLLQLELRIKGESMRGKCPVCESADQRNLVVTPKKGVYYCFSNEKGGDQLALIAHIRGCSVKEAAAWLAGDIPKETKVEEPADGFKALEYLEHDHPAVDAVGIEPEDAEKIGIGYAGKGILKGTVAVPIRDETGKLLGYIGITEAKLPPKWSY